MWDDRKVFHDVKFAAIPPNAEGASGIAFKWVCKYLEQHKDEIPDLAPDEVACPSHTPAYRQNGKLWLMGPLFLEWLRGHLGAPVCPKIMVRYLMALDAKLTYIVFSPFDRYPVIRLPIAGAYTFGRSSIVLRGVAGDGVEQRPVN